jgi:parvulin-like peptidyl-prolyl isomerase
MTLYVNGEALESSLIDAEVQRLRPAYEQTFAGQDAEQREKQLTEWARENLIESFLFRQQAHREFGDVSEQDVNAMLAQLLSQESETGPLHLHLQSGDQTKKQIHEDIADQIRQDRLNRRLTENVPAPSEKAIVSHYKKHVDQFTIPELVHAAHIIKHPGPDCDLQSAKEQIDAIYEQLKAGTPFEELASQHSDCPDNAGSLGFFPRGRMVPAFEEVAFSLPEGTYSEPFQTEFGWHIAKVIKKQASTVCPLDDVRQVIARDLTQQARQAAVEAYLDDLRKKAVIEEK